MRKTMAFGFLVLFFLALSISAISPELTYSKMDYLKYIGSDVGLTKAYSEYEICNPTSVDFAVTVKSKSTFNWYFVEAKGKLKDSWFEIRTNETYDYQEWIPKIVCNPYYDSKNGTIIQNCTDNGNFIERVGWQWVWSKFNPDKYTYPKASCFRIRVYGTYEPAYLDNGIAIDNVLEFAGYNFDEYAWWNVTWARKKAINASVASGSTGLYYQILLNVSYDSDMNVDFSDLRFLNSTENGELDYWIISKVNSSYAHVWLEVGEDINTTNRTVAYMYYGNAGASTTSNIQTTFVHGDDFENGWNSTKWGIGGTAGNNVTTGILNTQGNGTEGMIYTLNYTTTAQRYMFTFDTKEIPYVGVGYSAFDFGMTGYHTSGEYMDNFYNKDDYQGHIYRWTTTWTANGTHAHLVPSANDIIDIDFTVGSSGWNVYKNGVNQYNVTATLANPSNAIGFRTYGTTQYIVLDYVFVRKLSYPEPVSNFGYEETNSSLAPTLTTLYINGASSNATHAYTPSTNDNLTAVVNVSGLYVAIFRNGTLMANASTTSSSLAITPAGYWNITAYTAGNATHSSSYATYWLNVTKADVPLHVCFNNQTFTECLTTYSSGFWHLTEVVNLTNPYPNNLLNVTAWNDAGVSINLYRDTTIINSENNTFIILPINASGYYIYNYSYGGNANYSANYSANTVYSLVKGTPPINITFNTSDYVVQNTAVNITCNHPSQISVNLYNDTSSLTNPYVQNFTTIGNFNFTCNTTGNQNYTAATTNKSLTVIIESGLIVNVYNEENTTQGITFNITVNNGTASDTAYNQNNPYTNNSILGILTIDISSDGYSQRTYYNTTATGNTTTINAYLLPTSSGSWIIFYVYNAIESPIQNALINVERMIPPSSWLLIAQKKTDTAGTATIFLDPVTTYNFSVSAAGYISQTFQLQPSASPYLITLTATSGVNITYDAMFKNIILEVQPYDAGLIMNQTYPFFYYINSTDSYLEFFGWNITFWNGTLINFTNVSTASGGNLTESIDTSIWNSTIYLNYWFKKQNFTTFSQTYIYRVWNVTATNTSIMALVNDIQLGTFEIDADSFAFLSVIMTIILMATASHVSLGKDYPKMFGSGIIGLGIMAIFTSIGTYVWGGAYLMGWTLFGLLSLGVVAAIWIRGGFG